jgi:general stress protein 26
MEVIIDQNGQDGYGREMEDTKKLILNFLALNSLGVISTVGKNAQPEAALVAFAETPELELIFQTQSNTRKYQNLQQNSKVALVIGWDSVIHKTLQYEGVASEVAAQDSEKYIKIFKAKKTPCTEDFLNEPNVKFFKVVPTWIGFSDYTGKKPQITELFFS